MNVFGENFVALGFQKSGLILENLYLLKNTYSNIDLGNSNFDIAAVKSMTKQR